MTKFGTAIATALLAMSLSACGGTSGAGSTPPDQILVTIMPSTTSVPTTENKKFHAYVFHDPSTKGVEWKLSGIGCTGDGCGTLSHVTTDSVTYIAPSTPPVPAAVTLTTTAIADPTKSAAAKVFVFTPGTISISVVPADADLKLGGSVQLTATVANDVANAGVVWKVSGDRCSIVLFGTDCGAVSPAATGSGVPTTYTSHALLAGTSPVQVVATSATDPSVSASAVIHLTTLSASPQADSVSYRDGLGYVTTVNPGPNRVNFELGVLKEWNGRLLFIGNGGFAGGSTSRPCCWTSLTRFLSRPSQ